MSRTRWLLKCSGFGNALRMFKFQRKSKGTSGYNNEEPLSGQEIPYLNISRPTKNEVKETIEEESTEHKNKHNSSRWYLWLRQRSTVSIIIFFVAAAVAFAVGHGLFFIYLDGTITEHRHIQQSQVTTVSLLMTTAFKACITAAVGLSFVQYLWRVLRQEALAIGRIEQLFSLRSNPFELTRVRGLFQTPLLFSMALFLWLVPIAIIYPPSALTVSFRPYTVMNEVDLPELFPSVSNWNPGLNPGDWTNRRLSMASLGFHQPNKQGNFEVYFNYSFPTAETKGLARSIALTGEIPRFDSPTGENASYSMEFTSPQLTCNKSVAPITEQLAFNANGSLNIFHMTWDSIVPKILWYNGTKYNPDPVLTISYPSQIFAYPGPPKSYKNVTYYGQFEFLTCRPGLATFNVSVSYVRSNRQISYTTRDFRPFVPKTSIEYDVKNETKLSVMSIYNASTIPEKAKADLVGWDKWAILEASLSLLEYDCIIEQNDTRQWWPGSVDYTLPNGTIIKGREPLYQSCGSKKEADKKALDISTFNPTRYVMNGTLLETDPRKYNITQESLNAYIANVTIAALSLNLGKAKTPVMFTEYRTTYHFSNPINLVLPYSLTLLFGAVFVAIGIWALHQNGASAMDGGFLQIMTTTIGRSKMEELIVQHHVTLDRDNIPREVLDLKIRYGELVDDEGVGTGIAGFGTAEETRMLRKGWASG